MTTARKAARTASAAVLDWLRTEPRLFLKPRAVISFPKSGRTWLCVMLNELGIPAQYRHAEAETAAPLIEEIDRRDWRRFRRSLIQVRDPRDTVISYFHACMRRNGIHAGMRHLYPPTLAEFLRDPRFGVEKIARYNLLWASIAAEEASMRILTYERLHAETAVALMDVAGFFGCPVAPQQVARVVEECSFERMRQREASGEYGERYGRKLQPADPEDPDSYKVRKGTVGGYREEMGPEEVEYCDRLLERLGYFNVLDACLRVASVGNGRVLRQTGS